MARMDRMIIRNVKKLVAWAIALVLVVLMASGAWWLLSVV